MSSTVIVFGAGATKACGGPLTAEILPWFYDPQLRDQGLNNFIQHEGFADLLEKFLIKNFHLPPSVPDRRKEDYPALMLLLSLIDTAIDRKQSFEPARVPELIRDTNALPVNSRHAPAEVRRALEYLIFALLEYKMKHQEHNYYYDLLEKFYPQEDTEPVVISLNYDLFTDNAMIRLSEHRVGSGVFPDYGCDMKTPAYKNQPAYFGKLFKLYGSVNWSYCPGCHRLDLGVSEGMRSKTTVKVLNELYRQNPLEDLYSGPGNPCPDCGVFVRPVLITPMHPKDHRNPHIAQTWYRAESALRQAGHVIFIGYSLPDDDVELIYMLKQSLNRPGIKITVVEMDGQNRSLRDHPVGARYRVLFGDDLDWRNKGFGEYVRSLG